jgi:hypothetical protein
MNPKNGWLKELVEKKLKHHFSARLRRGEVTVDQFKEILENVPGDSVMRVGSGRIQFLYPDKRHMCWPEELENK